MQGSEDQLVWTDLLVTELVRPADQCSLLLEEFQIDESKSEGWYRFIRITFTDYYGQRSGLHFFDIAIKGMADFEHV